MIQFFPLALWLAMATSVASLVALWSFGEIGATHAAILVAWCAVAGYCQFFSASASSAAVGLALQTCLAIYLLLRMKLMA
jgi:hypothetical protein